jgi:hypothetical protein
MHAAGTEGPLQELHPDGTPTMQGDSWDGSRLFSERFAFLVRSHRTEHCAAEDPLTCACPGAPAMRQPRLAELAS